MIIFYCVISPSLVAGDGSAAAVAAPPSSVSASCASILLTLQFLHSTVFTLPYLSVHALKFFHIFSYNLPTGTLFSVHIIFSLKN
jgi:hypothetical protein